MKISNGVMECAANGVMEYRSNGVMKKPHALAFFTITPLFHHSNIPLPELSIIPVSA